jgi:hypothetical protein
MAKAPDWSPEETRVLEPYVRGVLRRQFKNSGAAAREYLLELDSLRRRYPNAKWLRTQRDFKSVQSKINQETRKLGRSGRPPGWTPQETQITGRYVRALLRGEYRSVHQAARACHRELTLEYRLHRGADGFPMLRSYVSAYGRMIEDSRRQGRTMVRAKWSGQELRVIDDHARAVAEGRLRNAKQASRQCAQDLDRLRRRYPNAGWLAVERHWQGIYRVMLKRARDLGRRPTSFIWSPVEKRLLDHYARQVVRGEYRDAKQAARELLRRLDQLYAKPRKLTSPRVRRSLHHVHCLLCERAHELGWSRQHLFWSPREEQIINRYVNELLAGRFRHARAAGAACKHELDRLHEAHPNARWAEKRRTQVAVNFRITQRTRATGEAWPHSRWTIPEKRIVERYAHAVLEGRFPNLPKATERCHRDIERYHRQLRKQRPGSSPAPSPRSPKSLLDILRKRTLELGRPKRRLDWTPQEMRVVMKWARKYQAMRKHFHALGYSEAAREVRRELERQGFNRTQIATHHKLEATVHRIWGFYQAQGRTRERERSKRLQKQRQEQRNDGDVTRS